MPISHNRPPRKIDNRELRRVVEDVYKDINELKNSINRVYEGPPSPTQGKRGDIAVYKDGKNHVLACKTKDGWARIGLSVPKKHNEPFKGVGISRDTIKLGGDEAVFLESGTSLKPRITLKNTNSNTLPASISFVKSPRDNSIANSDYMGIIGWSADDSNSTDGSVTYSDIYSSIVDKTDGSVNSKIVLETKTNSETNTFAFNDGYISSSLKFDVSATNKHLISHVGVVTLGGSVADLDFMELTPTVNESYTVTRLNYVHMDNVGGTGTVTDACAIKFDANAGTHKAVDSGSTKSSPGTVSAWMKINVNGTVYYVPAYTSKTS